MANFTEKEILDRYNERMSNARAIAEETGLSIIEARAMLPDSTVPDYMLPDFEPDRSSYLDSSNVHMTSEGIQAIDTTKPVYVTTPSSGAPVVDGGGVVSTSLFGDLFKGINPFDNQPWDPSIGGINIPDFIKNLLPLALVYGFSGRKRNTMLPLLIFMLLQSSTNWFTPSGQSPDTANNYKDWGDAV